MKLFKILFASALALTLASCNSHKLEVTSFNFVTFNSRSANITEDVGSFSIPVSVFPGKVDKEFRVSVKVNAASTAVAEENYTIENDVLTFSPSDEETTKNIVVNIVNKEGIFTGNLSLVLELASVSVDDVVISGSTSCTITIKDNDHPLTTLFGDYTMAGISNSSTSYIYPNWSMSISAYDGDVTRIWIDKCTYFHSAYADYIDGPVYGIVSNDMKTITIPTPQTLPSTAAAFAEIDEPWTLYKYDGSNLNAAFIETEDTIVFTLDEESGAYVTTDSYGLAMPGNVGEGWFWYYMNVFGGFNTNYPAYFKKAE